MYEETPMSSMSSMSTSICFVLLQSNNRRIQVTKVYYSSALANIVTDMDVFPTGKERLQWEGELRVDYSHFIGQVGTHIW